MKLYFALIVLIAVVGYGHCQVVSKGIDRVKEGISTVGDVVKFVGGEVIDKVVCKEFF